MLEGDDAMVGEIGGGIENGFKGRLVRRRVHSSLIGWGMYLPIYVDD
jgi:hypothetical protein